MLPFILEKLDEIHRHALEQYPFECCGIIIGKENNDNGNKVNIFSEISPRRISPNNNRPKSPTPLSSTTTITVTIIITTTTTTRKTTNL